MVLAQSLARSLRLSACRAPSRRLAVRTMVGAPPMRCNDAAGAQLAAIVWLWCLQRARPSCCPRLLLVRAPLVVN